MKSADQILTGRCVHSGLSTDRSINLSEQRRGHLNKRDTAQISSRRESRQVAHNPAAKRDHRIASFKSSFSKKRERLFQRTERLVTLALRHQPMNCLEGFCFQTS